MVQKRQKSKKKHRVKENHHKTILKMHKQQVQPGERLEKRRNTNRTNNAKTQQKEHEKTQHEKCSKLVKKKKKTREKNAARIYHFFLVNSRARTLGCAPKVTQQPFLPALPATCHTTRTKKKRKTLTPGVIFLKKTTNENAVLKRFQISVSNRVDLIGP